MLVKDLIIKLLDCDMNKNVSIEYPTNKIELNNYYRYKDTEDFKIVDCSVGVILGVDDDN